MHLDRVGADRPPVPAALFHWLTLMLANSSSRFSLRSFSVLLSTIRYLSTLDLRNSVRSLSTLVSLVCISSISFKTDVAFDESCVLFRSICKTKKSNENETFSIEMSLKSSKVYGYFVNYELDNFTAIKRISTRVIHFVWNKTDFIHNLYFVNHV